MFAALHLTPYAAVKAVILGQDPYHGPGQAHGLCFSVRPGVAPPPSLQNIYKELESRPGRPAARATAASTRGPRQGVLLLNASLTVRQGRAASHQGKGWETFTDEVLRAVNDKPERVVFILWGASARKKKALIDTGRAHGDRVAAPVAAVGVERVLRQPPVLPGQRRAGRGGPGPDRLADPRAVSPPGPGERRRLEGARHVLGPGGHDGGGRQAERGQLLRDRVVAQLQATPSPSASTWAPAPPWVKAVAWGTPSM